MRMLWWVFRIFLAFIIFAPQVVALDLIIGLLMGVSHGVANLFDIWLALFTRVTDWLDWPETIAKVAIGVWSFAALGLGIVRVLLQE